MSFSVAKKTLLRRLADGHFHSGQSLGDSLGISRTAVWSLIQELQGLGLEVHSVRGKGYRLAHGFELLDVDSIREAMSTEARQLLRVLEVHDELDSTNSHLMRLEAAQRSAGRVCLAECQTAGRGRIGRAWQSPFGGNVCLSMLWQFRDQSMIAGLSLAVGVAVARALRRIGVSGAGLKWPNDILWSGRKLGGILLEVSGEANDVYNVVIGVGINGSLAGQQTALIDQPWIDLREVMGLAAVPRNQLVASLLDELFRVLNGYESGGLARHIDEWRSYHCQHGQSVCLSQGDQAIAGVIAGVTDDGMLLLDTENGGRRTFASGDLRLRAAHD
jgi:BirA family biotin operon repressor/biotin-[acetyl-CoA-carboxylase] ligase